MAHHIGFIGVGNMGKALIKGFLNNKLVEPEHIYACDKQEQVLRKLGDETGVKYSCESHEILDGIDILFLAVKPQDMDFLLKHIGPKLNDILVISIAAGISTQFIESRAPTARVVRVMPNTPALVFEMAGAYSLGKSAKPEDDRVVSELLSTLGVCVKVEENLIDAVTGLSGSGPAYIFKAIHGMIEGAKQEGLSEEVAIKLTAQTVKGAAELFATSGKTPQELITMVASPGGTTVEGLKALDEFQVEKAYTQAVVSSAARSRELASD